MFKITQVYVCMSRFPRSACEKVKKKKNKTDCPGNAGRKAEFFPTVGMKICKAKNPLVTAFKAHVNLFH